ATGVVLAATWSLAAAAQAASPVAATSAFSPVSATPALDPPYRSAVHDYVSRCEPAGGMTMSMVLPQGTTAAVDGGPPRTGSFTQPVTLAAGQAFTFTLTTSAGASDYHVRCLPSDFPAYTAQRTGGTQAGWYAVTPDQFVT